MIPTNKYFKLCHHGPCILDSFTHIASLPNSVFSVVIFQYFNNETYFNSFDYNPNKKGKINQVMIKPPTINEMVATNDGHCKLLKPMIACPLVQPPA